MIDSYLQIKRRKVHWLVKKWICWIPPINGRFKLNFDGSRVENKNVSGWVIGDFNGTIEMIANKHICNALIIIAENDFKRWYVSCQE